jgi:hypothetical protein
MVFLCLEFKSYIKETNIKMEDFALWGVTLTNMSQIGNGYY